MQEILDALNRLSETITALICAVSLIYGILECFFGYKIMKLMFAIQGFFLGGFLGMCFAGFLMKADTAGTLILCGLIFGILGAWLLYKFYLIGVFCSNASMVFLIGLLLGGTDEGSMITWGLIGIIVGVLAVKFVRIWVIAVTGVVGGMSAGTAFMGLLGIFKTGPALLAGIVLAVLGILYQWKTTDGEFIKTKKRAPVQAAPVQAAPAQTVSVQSAPVQTTPVQTVPVRTAPVAKAAPVCKPAEPAPAWLIQEQPETQPGISWMAPKATE